MQRWPEFRHPLFVGAVLFYAAYQLNRFVLAWPLPSLLTSYLSDVASMPVILSLALAAQRRLIARSLVFIFPSVWLVAAWLYVSVWFEGILPLFSPTAVADLFDVFAYAIGTIAFRYWLNRPASVT